MPNPHGHRLLTERIPRSLDVTKASYPPRSKERITQMSDIWNIVQANFRELRTREVRRILLPRTPVNRPSTGSAAHAVADVGGLRCVDHPDDLQLDARRQHLE